MEKISKVFYTIANIFNWIMAIICIALIAFGILALVGVIPNGGDALKYGSIGTIVVFSIILIICLITIAMVRRAKDPHSTKLWDILFIIFGIFEWNIFYILGGIFGLIAIRR